MQERRLHFSKKAWQKLNWLYSFTKNEVGGFGLATDKNKLLFVDDIVLSKQTTTAAHIDWDDNDLNQHMCRGLKQGHSPAQTMRIWIHTHPHMLPNPSSVDEGTLKECFSQPDWMIMFILGHNSKVYCRYVNNKEGWWNTIPVVYDSSLVPASKEDIKKWTEEYHANVTERSWVFGNQNNQTITTKFGANTQIGYHYSGGPTQPRFPQHNNHINTYNAGDDYYKKYVDQVTSDDQELEVGEFGLWVPVLDQEEKSEDLWADYDKNYHELSEDEWREKARQISNSAFI